ncbi:plasmacytoid dendritic cell antigen processing and presentation [Mactra antiquata]
MMFISLFVLFGVFCVGKCCTDGWITHGSKCYHLSRDEETWMGAKEMCKLMHGSLAFIEDKAEADFLHSQVRVIDENFWIALTDLESEGTWKWVNSVTSVDPPYLDWGVGQPDNADAGQDCAIIAVNEDFQWADEHCEDSFFYVCERDNNNMGSTIG